MRQVTGWICRRPDDLNNCDTEQLQAILNRCPQPHAAAELVRAFADMLTYPAGAGGSSNGSPQPNRPPCQASQPSPPV